MKTKGLWVIKFIDYSIPVYFAGFNHVDTQLRKAKIYVWKEEADRQAIDLLRRKRFDRPIVIGRYQIVEIEIKEKA